MRRACRRSARILARVVVPTRRGPSMTMKWGGCGPLCGTRARRAAEDSLAAIRSVCPGRTGGMNGIIAELFPLEDQRGGGAGMPERAGAALRERDGTAENVLLFSQKWPSTRVPKEGNRGPSGEY